MFKRGYARLMAASIAAIGLHALLLVWANDSTLFVATDMKSSSLHVALLPSQQSMNAFDLAKPPGPISKQTIEKDRREKSLPPEGISMLEPEVSYDDSSEIERVASDQIEDRNDVLPAKQSPSSSEAALVPVEVQATILANVTYPRQARRRGWEGEAALRFNINSQLVQSVTMHTSTGYPVLDRAARLGLVSLRTLPLKDGDYRLPVVFRLQ